MTAVAMVFPEPEKGGRGKKSQSKTEGFHPDLLTKARYVLANAPDIAKAVLDG